METKQFFLQCTEIVRFPIHSIQPIHQLLLCQFRSMDLTIGGQFRRRL